MKRSFSAHSLGFPFLGEAGGGFRVLGFGFGSFKASRVYRVLCLGPLDLASSLGKPRLINTLKPHFSILL